MLIVSDFHRPTSNIRQLDDLLRFREFPSNNIPEKHLRGNRKAGPLKASDLGKLRRAVERGLQTQKRDSICKSELRFFNDSSLAIWNTAVSRFQDCHRN